MLTFITIDKPLWFIMIAMFLIGLGLGQLMQTLTLASQNAVAANQMGVATGAATFFRQIGGTLGCRRAAVGAVRAFCLATSSARQPTRRR